MPYPFPSFLRAAIVDLETAPIDDTIDFIEEPSAPANYKDPEKIEAYIREARAKAIDEAGLDLDLARIVAVGHVPYPDGAVDVRICKTESEEREALGALRELLESSRLITFCGARFDLPLLARRFLYLGLDPLTLELDRYKSPHIDLYERLSLRGYAGAHKLSWYCKRLGWTDCISPLQGAEIAQAAREGRWDEIHDHCAADLTATARLASWMGIQTRELPAVVPFGSDPDAPKEPII